MRSAPSTSNTSTPRRDQDTMYTANDLISKNVSCNVSKKCIHIAITALLIRFHSFLRQNFCPLQDIVGLRKLAAIRGLATHGLRSRAWPLILGVHDKHHDHIEYQSQSSIPHKDSHVVECDMARSLWNWTQGWSETARADKRSALKRIIDASICGNSQDIYYYQGLHDVAAVLLFVVGEQYAYKMLSHLASTQLRDFTRPNLDAAIEVLSLLYPILRVADPELHQFITSLRDPALETPFFALSWHMTWFSHDVPSLDQCARLFDLFISSHPLMSLYVAAVAVKDQRESILACNEDASLVYSTLKKMTFLGPGQLDADELAQQAVALYKKAPPTSLARKAKKNMEHSTTLDAYIDNERWYVPNSPGQKSKRKRLASAAYSTVSEPLKKRPNAAAAVVGMGLAGAAVLGTSMLLSLLQAMGNGS